MRSSNPFLFNRRGFTAEGRGESDGDGRQCCSRVSTAPWIWLHDVWGVQGITVRALDCCLCGCSFFFFFCFPSYISGVHLFGWDFCWMWLVFNPTKLGSHIPSLWMVVSSNTGYVNNFSHMMFSFCLVSFLILQVIIAFSDVLSGAGY